MDRSDIERAAYIAAHAIDAADKSAPTLACKGARQTHKIDVIANIIINVFTVGKGSNA